ncbi:MAG: gfo/Idh/MocA family oxidoreductase [Planctomycetota bacterium]|nr:MAG: gfo/Idh/MocA family oxidoreductase [Planctomycetota bacterium]
MRRDFLKNSAATAAMWVAHQARAESPDRKLGVGLIGPGGMGTGHLNQLVKRTDIELRWVCDVDRQRLEKAHQTATNHGHPTQGTGDLRQVLADPRIDAVFIATPDHWHGPAAILALNAGKHVYVEKPCCHNIREGQLMQEAVQRSGKKLQVGTQSRSTGFVREGIEHVLRGEIGEVLVAKAWNSQRRGSIGKTQPTTPPEPLDFDTWLGPAVPVPYRTNLLHGVWRWWYDFGCGDMGNDGVHDIDVATWGLGVAGLPNRVTCLGGKNFFDDDQQFPDTQYVVCEYPTSGAPAGRHKQLIFEQRIWSPYVQEGYENGAAFYGTEGVLILGHSVGWKLYGPRNKLLAEGAGSGDLAGHHQNFFDAIRKDQTPHADILAGTTAAAIVHYGNIAARVGRVLNIDQSTGRITGDAVADALTHRAYRPNHWATPSL